MTVTLYKITCTQAYMMSEQGARYSLSPWGKNTIDYKGEDDGGKEYILPDYLQVVTYINGKMGIETTNGDRCILGIGKNDLPVVQWHNGHKDKHVTLQKA